MNLITIAKSRGTQSVGAAQHSMNRVLGVPQPARVFEPDDILVLFGQARDIRRLIRGQE